MSGPIIYTIIIPRQIESGNVFAYGHWRTRIRDRDSWESFFTILARHVPKATGRRAVTITAYRKRRVDEDNLSSGFKHGRDAMVRLGLLTDDNKKGCDFLYNDCLTLSDLNPLYLKKYGRIPITEILIEDICPL